MALKLTLEVHHTPLSNNDEEEQALARTIKKRFDLQDLKRLRATPLSQTISQSDYREWDDKKINDKKITIRTTYCYCFLVKCPI